MDNYKSEELVFYHTNSPQVNAQIQLNPNQIISRLYHRN